VSRPTLECRTAPSALVPTAVNPPPAPSRWGVRRHPRIAQRNPKVQPNKGEG